MGAVVRPKLTHTPEVRSSWIKPWYEMKGQHLKFLFNGEPPKIMPQIRTRVSSLSYDRRRTDEFEDSSSCSGDAVGLLRHNGPTTISTNSASGRYTLSPKIFKSLLSARLLSSLHLTWLGWF
uniref:Uncharacterized protein n=1 Tax=Bionectria ochroleuca TaxID=29856 RepID=A0A8H7NC70_BIOOC